MLDQLLRGIEVNDKALGYTIVVVTLIVMIGYFVWFFAPAFGAVFAWLAPYAEWAYKLPILVGVYLMLFIVLWIGYTMATTPPPIPLENPLDLEREETSVEEGKEEKQ
jgi:membrane protein implicated in regulation of membrane protease activity